MLILDDFLDGVIQGDEDIFNTNNYVPFGFHRELISPCGRIVNPNNELVPPASDYEVEKSDAVVQK